MNEESGESNPIHDTPNKKNSRLREFLKSFKRSSQPVLASHTLSVMDIRSTLTSESYDPPVQLTHEELSQIHQEIEAGRESPYIFDVKPIYRSNASPEYLEDLKNGISKALGEEIAEKVAKIPHVKRMGVVGLFDGVYQKFSGVNPRSIQFKEHHAERGQVHVLHVGHEGIVSKDWQGKHEPEIAKIASDNHLGPTQYGIGIEALEDYLPEGGLNTLSPSDLSTRAGELLRGLHDNNIIYGDSIHDHLRLDIKDDRLKLIDFGVSFLYDGSAPVDPDYLWKVIPLAAPEGANSREIYNDPVEREKYTHIPPEIIKQGEYERMQNTLHYMIEQRYAGSDSGMPLTDPEIESIDVALAKGYNQISEIEGSE